MTGSYRIRHDILAAAVALGVLMTTAPAGADPATPDAVSALARRAAVVVAEDCGLEAARRAFLTPGAFLHDEIYVNVIDTNGTWRIYPPNPKNAGRSVLNVVDETGRLLVQDIIRLAREHGEGWTSYRWLNPKTNRIEDKDTYVVHVPACGLIAYVGVYRGCEGADDCSRR